MSRDDTAFLVNSSNAALLLNLGYLYILRRRVRGKSQETIERGIYELPMPRYRTQFICRLLRDIGHLEIASKEHGMRGRGDIGDIPES
jgi:hypothetical protein